MPPLCKMPDGRKTRIKISEAGTKDKTGITDRTGWRKVKKEKQKKNEGERWTSRRRDDGEVQWDGWRMQCVCRRQSERSIPASERRG